LEFRNPSNVVVELVDQSLDIRDLDRDIFGEWNDLRENSGGKEHGRLKYLVVEVVGCSVCRVSVTRIHVGVVFVVSPRLWVQLIAVLGGALLSLGL